VSMSALCKADWEQRKSIRANERRGSRRHGPSGGTDGR
jgi:hypothetical protein